MTHDVIYSKGRHWENITDQKLSKEHIARVSNKEYDQSYYFNSDGLGFFLFQNMTHSFLLPNSLVYFYCVNMWFIFYLFFFHYPFFLLVSSNAPIYIDFFNLPKKSIFFFIFIFLWEKNVVPSRFLVTPGNTWALQFMPKKIIYEYLVCSTIYKWQLCKVF